jgi:hypothetical protein
MFDAFSSIPETQEPTLSGHNGKQLGINEWLTPAFSKASFVKLYQGSTIITLEIIAYDIFFEESCYLHDILKTEKTFSNISD